MWLPCLPDSDTYGLYDVTCNVCMVVHTYVNLMKILILSVKHLYKPVTLN